MKVKKVLLVPIMIMGITLSGCNVDASEQGVWETSDVYFEETNITIKSLQIVVSENIDVDYGTTREFSSEAAYTNNYSIWIDNNVLTEEENNYKFEMHNTTYYSEFTYENYSYTLSVRSKKKVSGEFYFTGTIEEMTSRSLVDVIFTQII